MKARKLLRPAERLIVAADFKTDSAQFHGRLWVRDQVIRLANELKGTGVYIKVNSILRAVGYDLIDRLHDLDLKVFADLKLNDIPETLATDGELLREARPELLTVMCSTGRTSMEALKKELPETEILGVTVLTSLTEEEVRRIYKASLESVVDGLADLSDISGLDGVISSAREATRLREILSERMTINTPAIRPVWSIVKSDDQNQKRVMTPAEAIKAGADRIVVGRPIVQAEKPYDAVMRTIEEIASAIA
ncbi:MAG: orotidine-5'-phosphate decarboxylase [Candidatus Paceibacterota bacterium]